MSQKTYMYDTQWTALINAINGGDTSAIATALGYIKTSVDSITTALSSLSTDVTQDSTQWNNLINAINNQSLTVDLSNITSSVVRNLSGVSGSFVTDALDYLDDTKQDSSTAITIDNIATQSVNRSTYADSLLSAYAIPINTDLNDYNLPGYRFTCRSNDIAATLMNCPVAMAFTLDILPLTTDITKKFVMQILYPWNGRIYKRAYQDWDNNWTPWISI